ncbi:MAG: GNAT family N-acetyltransferase [Aliidongia sp.]
MIDEADNRLSGHPLDRPVWSALTTRQARFAQGDARAVRLAPAFGLFAAAADASSESLAALARLDPAAGGLVLIEAEPLPAGIAARRMALCHQMVAIVPRPIEPSFAITALCEDDAPDMLALATLTEPGPYFAQTHRLGDFFGVKQDNRLVAMAGERLKPEGFTEVSGVCTHPEYRGRGYAGGLMCAVATRILARGETPFLHAYASNRGAIALYHTLGFALRRVMTMIVMGATVRARSETVRIGPVGAGRAARPR